MFCFWKGSSVRWRTFGQFSHFRPFPRATLVTRPILPANQLASIKNILTAPEGTPATVRGWVRHVRNQKEVKFIAVNDGSCLQGMQIVSKPIKVPGLTAGCYLEARGRVVQSRPNHPVEIQAETLCVLGVCPEEYPIKGKKISYEFLREIAHLRHRTNTFGAVLRVRNVVLMAIHDWLQSHDYVNVTTPTLTTNDCEGGGDLFRVVCDAADGDFFGKPTFLTVSSQLHLETAACALGRVYTVSSAFRAEASHTRRHLAEFSMVEAEMVCTNHIDDILTVIDNLFRHVAQSVLDKCEEDMHFFLQRIDSTAKERLEHMLKATSVVMTYTDAVEALNKNTAPKFTEPAVWGKSLSIEHEKYLAGEFCQGGVYIIDYPIKAKPFYMRANDNSPTVACADFLVPDMGELAGGSLREERLDQLVANMKSHGIPLHNYDWYLDLRRYGTAPHGGFGMGVERLLLYLTGMRNIRDVIPFPRVRGTCFT